MLISKIANALKSYKNNIIVPQIKKDDFGKYLISLFDDERFSIELTVSILDQIYINESIDTRNLLKLTLFEILKNNNIVINSNTDSPIFISDKANNAAWGNEIIDKFKTLHRNILVRGEKRSGKTSLVKYFRSQNKLNKYLWLDFNCCAYNFLDVLLDLINIEYKNDSWIIILDNLECCGYELSEKIVSLFVDLVKLLNKNNRRFKLIIIQDNNYKIEWFLPKNKTKIIDVSRKTTIEDFCGKTSDKEEVDELEFISIIRQKNSEELFKEIWNKLNSNQQLLLYRLLNLSFLEIKPTLSNEEALIIKSIIKDNHLSGIKLYYNSRVQLYDKKCSGLFLKYISERCGITTKNTDKENILKEYLLRNELTYTETNNILHNYYFETIPTEDYSFLIDLAKKMIKDIENSVIERADNLLFENHLGAIVFAAEALSDYAKAEDDWNALHSWCIIKKYIYNTYYLGGQKLPEVFIDKSSHTEIFEGTYLDFIKNNSNENSIENQINLQNELLEKYNSEFPEITELEDSLFCYYLSKYQKGEKAINIDRFFKTYILSLIFEFEVTAPQKFIDKEIIQKLFNMICLNVEHNGDSVFFYPARVPWVSARMLLALERYDFNIIPYDQVGFCNELKEGLSKWLRECSIKFNYNSKSYRIWVAGTGKWNSVLETTMMCTFALRNYSEDTQTVSEGINYIEAQKEHWFNNNNYADGIWAYQSIFMAKTPNNDMERISEIKEYLNPLKEYMDISTNKKNDRSLGETHISKTLISLINGFSLSIKRNIIKSIEKRDYVNTNNKKYKIGVTFTGKTRSSIVEPVCEKLIERFGFEERELFYDAWHTEEIAGIHADNILKEIYSDNCECIVVFLSDDYKTKHWTNNVEWEAIKTMINTEEERRILLLNVDSVNIDTIEGLDSKRDIFIDISNENNDQIARRINRFYSKRIEQQ